MRLQDPKRFGSSQQSSLQHPDAPPYVPLYGMLDFVSPYDATMCEILRGQGAIIIGKTNLDEFAMGSSNLHSHFGPALNAHNRGHVAGGSSGGSASSVASGACLASVALLLTLFTSMSSYSRTLTHRFFFFCCSALGSDTGGSVRLPASYQGIVGLKPTYGTFSRWGLVAYASSLDTPGLLVEAVEDSELLFGLFDIHDPRDPTSVPSDIRTRHRKARPAHGGDGSLKGLRVGIPREYLLPELDDEVVDAWSLGIDLLADQGAEIKAVSLPHTREGLPAYYVLATSEASSNLARYDGIRYGSRDLANLSADFRATTRADGFGLEVQRRILMGTFSLSASNFENYYIHAQKVRTRVRHDFDVAFGEVDVLLVPTARSSAPTLEAELGPSDDEHQGVKSFLNDVFTVPSSLAGLPSISVPAGKCQQGLPLGLQLIAPRFREDVLFLAGKILDSQNK